MSDAPSNVTSLPAANTGPRGLGVPDELPTHDLPLTLRIMLDERMFEKVKTAASMMAGAEGFIAKHLQGKPQACFAVITRSMDWKLDPYFVAQATYQTPNGAVGFEGKLCQAILENSGRFIGGIRFEHTGDWSKITGMFEIVKGSSGKDYPKPTWTKKEAAGLGVTVIGHVRGEAEPRRWSIELVQAYPLNSPLWATDPRSQICYLAVRRFGDLAAPGIYGGVRFNIDEYLDASDAARDVTQPIQVAELMRETRSVVDAGDDEIVWEAFDTEGELVGPFKTAQAFTDAVLAIFADAAKRDLATLQLAFSNNEQNIAALKVERLDGLASQIEKRYADLVVGITPKPATAEPASAGAAQGETASGATSAPPAGNDAVAASTEQVGEATADEGAKENEIVVEAGPEQEPETAPHDPFWDSGALEVEMPKRPKGGTNWPAYAEHMTKLVAGAPTRERIADFRRANTRNLSNLRLSYAGGYQEFEEAEKARAGVI